MTKTKKRSPLLTLFYLLIAAVVVFLGVAAIQPSEFHVSRSLEIATPASQIFPLVNNQQKWNDWSPWAKLDPNAKWSVEGPDAGVGSIAHWEGNMKVGAGSSTITESRKNEFVGFQLDFTKPMKSTSTASFTFKEEGDKTLVTWSMDGKNNFIGKAMSLIFNCEKMVGGQFEKGLENLKTITEK